MMKLKIFIMITIIKRNITEIIKMEIITKRTNINIKKKITMTTIKTIIKIINKIIFTIITITNIMESQNTSQLIKKTNIL